MISRVSVCQAEVKPTAVTDAGNQLLLFALGLVAPVGEHLLLLLLLAVLLNVGRQPGLAPCHVVQEWGRYREGKLEPEYSFCTSCCTCDRRTGDGPCRRVDCMRHTSWAGSPTAYRKSHCSAGPCEVVPF